MHNLDIKDKWIKEELLYIGECFNSYFLNNLKNLEIDDKISILACVNKNNK